MNRSLTVFFLLVLTGITAQAQMQTTEQCVSTIRARAGMTIGISEIRKMCAGNSIEVVECAVTQIQGARFSGNLEQAVKECRANWRPYWE